MNFKQLGVAVVVSMTSLAGCGGGADSNLYDELVDAEASAVAAACECYELDEFESEAECVENFDLERSAEEVACLRDVYRTNREGLQAEADCRLTSFADVEACFDDVAACDEEAHQACFDAVNEAMELCPEPSPTIQDAREACEDDGQPT